MSEQKETPGFDYSVLANFCAVRNTSMAGTTDANPSPRLRFIMDLLDKLGIEYELDHWQKEQKSYSFDNLEDYFGFSSNEIDAVLADVPDYWTTERVNEERILLKSSFLWFRFSIERLEEMVQQSERIHESQSKIRMLKTLISIKKNKQKKSASALHYFNLYLKGTSNKMLMAHHDVVNVRVDNANDNSASVINAIACKTMMPELNVAITDGEEIGGIGAERAAKKIKNGHFGDIEFVLNFELTAVGGKNFFIEDFRGSKLFKRISRLFPGVETYNTPFHDGIVLRRFGIDSIVINPVPRKPSGFLDYSILSYCHTAKDTIEIANFEDMKDFSEEVVLPILKNEEPNFKISDLKPDVIETPSRNKYGYYVFDDDDDDSAFLFGSNTKPDLAEDERYPLLNIRKR
jgi:hypothetical protein